jgi:hypothetical protein
MKRGIMFWIGLIFLSAIGGLLLGVYEQHYGTQQYYLLLGIGLIIYIFYINSKTKDEEIKRLENKMKKLEK